MNKLIEFKNKRISIQKEISQLKSEFDLLKSQFISSIEVIHNDIMKGESTSVIFQSSLKERWNDREETFKTQLADLNQRMIDVDLKLEEIYKSDVELGNLKKYDRILTLDEYIEKAQVIRSFLDEEKIDLEKYKILTKALLQYVDVRVNGELYKARDERSYYSDVILMNEHNQILFVRRNKNDTFAAGKYALPGGHIEPAEEAEIAGKREVFEELNLDLTEVELTPVGIYEDEKCKIHYFFGRIKCDELPVLEERELIQYEWVDPKDIESKDLIMNLKDNFKNVIILPIAAFDSTDIYVAPEIIDPVEKAKKLFGKRYWRAVNKAKHENKQI